MFGRTRGRVSNTGIEQQRSAERRVVTALFCDVVGSTSLAETMDPEDWADIVGETVAEMAGCVERTRRGIEMAAGASNLQCELVGNFMVADQQLRLGEPESAILHLERTFELGELCNAITIVKLGHAWLTAAKASLGDLAADGFAGPLATAQACGSRSGEAAVRLQRAIATSGSSAPDWPFAFNDFEQAIALFESIDARPDQARAVHAYANALDAAGRDEESRIQLDEAAAMFDEMGIRPDTVPV